MAAMNIRAMDTMGTIDARGPRFAASLTTVVLAVTLITGSGTLLAVQAAVGLLGFYLHGRANLRGPSPDLFDSFVFGAPAMAPLLLPNLSLLCGMGLWVLRDHLPAGAGEPAAPAATS